MSASSGSRANGNAHAIASGDSSIAGIPDGPGDPKPSNLSYVPYQRKSHARNASTLSQLSQSSAGPTSQPAKSTGAPSHHQSVPTVTAPLAPAPAPVAGTSALTPPQPQHRSLVDPSRQPATSTPPRASARLAGSASSLSVPPPPPLVRLGAASSSRHLPAPPPLRSASQLRQAESPAASRQQLTPSAKSVGKQPQNADLHGQPRTATISLNQRTAAQPSASPSKKPNPHLSATSLSAASAANGGKVGANASHARTGSKVKAACLDSDGAASSKSSPMTSGTSTPRLNSASLTVPAHVHSYAALLAAQSKLGPIPVPQGVAIANAVGIDPGSAAGSAFANQQPGRSTAFRPGFQPKGAYRIRTDEFVEARRRHRGQGEMEEQRMERRFAKLVAIHFAPSAAQEGRGEKGAPVASSALDWDFEELRRDPRAALKRGGADLWSSLRARSKGEDLAKRAAEQSIVNWQHDDEVKACPICGTVFSLTVRKHHCRLCGRVVCASPHLSRPVWPDPGGLSNPAASGGSRDAAIAEHRKQLEKKCSGLIVADPVTGRIEDAHDPRGVPPGTATTPEKGVRICCDCKHVMVKRQYMMDDGTSPAYLKLYEALMHVQKEIEESLPEFQEMVLGLQKQDHVAALGSSAKANIELQRDAAQARKQLLTNFAHYDELAKRIRQLPTPSAAEAGGGGGGNGGSDAAQERVQQAIWTRANLFLQQNMLPLRSLPKPGAKKASEEVSGSDSGVRQGGSRLERAGGGGSDRRQGNGRTDSVSSMASFQTWLGGSGRERKAGGGTTSLTLAKVSRLQRDGEAEVQDGCYAEERDEGGVKGTEELEEQLGVLLEQERLVAEYVESASRARKFEDARTLKKSHDELGGEIVRVQRRIAARRGAGEAG